MATPEGNSPEATKSMMRKVRSLGCVGVLNRTALNDLKGLTIRSSPPRSNHDGVASKFSVASLSNSDRIRLNEKPPKDFSSCQQLSPLRDPLEPVGGSSLSLSSLNQPSAEDDMAAPPTPLASLINSRAVFYLSLIFLGIATFTNSSMHEVYTHNGPSSTKLGAAAISSLTDVFSPILPFTGGSDLRRVGENTFDGWEMLYPESGFSSIFNVKNIPRGGAVDPKTLKHGMSGSLNLQDRLAIRKTFEAAPTVLGNTIPFIPLDEIAEITLDDVAVIFRYAIESNRENFDETAFFAGVNPKLAKMIESMEAAVQEARGDGVLPAETKKSTGEKSLSDSGYGDIDSLQFCAAMRIFAEWRVLRQVPDGYKGYAVGMGLGLKDVVQNVAKIEAAVKGWIEEQKAISKLLPAGDNEISSFVSISNSTVIRTPTLRQILESEVELNIHKLPRLKEKSSAMGLLWVRRQLHYQTATFVNIRRQTYESVKDAVAAAYTEVYNVYHGWAVQKIFNYSFKAAPSAEEIFKTMNPAHYLKVVEKAKYMVCSNDEEVQNCNVNNEIPIEDIISKQEINQHHKKNIFIKLGHHIAKEWDGLGEHVQHEWGRFTNHVQKTIKDTGKVTQYVLHNEWGKVGKHIHTEWDNFGHHVQHEWNSIVNNIGSLFKRKNGFENDDLDVRGGGRRGDDSGLQGEALEKFLNDEMYSKARWQIEEYLEVAQPLLDDLAGLFEEMNMDDPTKV